MILETIKSISRYISSPWNKQPYIRYISFLIPGAAANHYNMMIVKGAFDAIYQLFNRVGFFT